MSELPGGDGNPMNALSYKLERLATRLHKNGDLSGAVTALKRANQVGGDVGTRLAKYLQKAGRYEEALAEIGRLESQAHALRKQMANRPTTLQDEAVASTLARLYGDGALIARRQKDFQQESRFKALCQQHGAVEQALRPINDDRRARVRELLQVHKAKPSRYRRLLRMFFPGSIANQGAE